MEFAYIGFTQAANLRSFQFERILPQARASDTRKVLRFTVVADLSLFPQCRVPIQEGPGISLQILAKALAGKTDETAVSASLLLEQADLIAFASAKAEDAAERMTRRKHRPPSRPSAASQLRLPPHS
ncbi:MAG TPA: hypothetical protein VFC21_06535 [Bryobacteraceae bacterium]|nr:hypothetical protein [Bryobacteraceae bacterium]